MKKILYLLSVLVAFSLAGNVFADSVAGSGWFIDDTTLRPYDTITAICDAGDPCPALTVDSLSTGAITATGALDMDGYDITMDTDGDSGFTNDRNVGIADDEIGVTLASTLDFLFQSDRLIYKNVGGILDFDDGDVTLTHSANTLAFAGATAGAGGYRFDASINSTSNTANLLIQNQTFGAPAAAIRAIQIVPTFIADAGQEHTVISIEATQNGAASDLNGVRIFLEKGTPATVLTNLIGVSIAAPSLGAGTVTTSYGINIQNVSLAGGTTAAAINIASQTANATTTRAIDITGTGVNNAIRFGADIDLYNGVANTLNIVGGGLNITENGLNRALTVVNQTTTYTTTTGRGFDTASSGALTGTAGTNLSEARIAPAFTLTNPGGAGTFSFYGLNVDLSSLAVTASVGDSTVYAGRFVGSNDADITNSRALYVSGGVDYVFGINQTFNITTSNAGLGIDINVTATGYVNAEGGALDIVRSGAITGAAANDTIADVWIVPTFTLTESAANETTYELIHADLSNMTLTGAGGDSTLIAGFFRDAGAASATNNFAIQAVLSAIGRVHIDASTTAHTGIIGALDLDYATATSQSSGMNSTLTLTADLGAAGIASAIQANAVTAGFLDTATATTTGFLGSITGNAGDGAAGSLAAFTASNADNAGAASKIAYLVDNTFNNAGNAAFVALSGRMQWVNYGPTFEIVTTAGSSGGFVFDAGDSIAGVGGSFTFFSGDGVNADGGGLSITTGAGNVAGNNGGDITLAFGASGGGAGRVGRLSIGGNAIPTANDGGSLGISGTAFSDLFLASGGIINFAVGDVTITHSANILAFAGAATRYSFDSLMEISGDIQIQNGSGLVVGNSAQITTDTVAEAQVLGTGQADTTQIIGRFDATAFGGEIQFVKGRGATIGSLTIVADNDGLGGISAFPVDGTDLATRSASISFEVDDATPAAGDIGTAIVWQTMAGGGLVLTEKMRLTAAGNLTLDPGTGTAQVTIDGSAGGCIMLRDTDDAGWTEVDALDGVLTASIDADGQCD